MECERSCADQVECDFKIAKSWKPDSGDLLKNLCPIFTHICDLAQQSYEYVFDSCEFRYRSKFFCHGIE